MTQTDESSCGEDGFITRSLVPVNGLPWIGADETPSVGDDSSGRSLVGKYRLGTDDIPRGCEDSVISNP